LGATTQNITQTGDLLVLREAHGIFLRLIGEALSAMADLAERGADMPIAGRTHGQHALPATFGYKPAVWIDELIRHVERFQQAAPRLFVAMLGGGAGAFASLGAQGPAVQAGLAKHLGMRPMRVPSRTLSAPRGFRSPRSASRSNRVTSFDLMTRADPSGCKWQLAG
jgi:3-carboxy-cis,cis-muconate cycloisomerase